MIGRKNTASGVGMFLAAPPACIEGSKWPLLPE